MSEYEYKNIKAEDLFRHLLILKLGDKIEETEQLAIFKKIQELEPGIEDPSYFYYYGELIKKRGKEDKAYSLFTKAYELSKEYPLSSIGYHRIGYSINKEIGIYNFEKGLKELNKEKAGKFMLLAKKHMKNALGYWFDPEYEQHDLLKKCIRWCDEPI